MSIKNLTSNSATGTNLPTVVDRIDMLDTRYDAKLNMILSALRPRTDKELLLNLLSESKGKCLGLSCGKSLIVQKRGKKSVPDCEIVCATIPFGENQEYDTAVALCHTCAKLWPQMTPEEQKTIIERRFACADREKLYSSIDGVEFEQEIEIVLRAVEEIKDADDLPKIKLSDLVETEKKISERRLLDNIKSDMMRLFNTVNEICGQLEQEIGFDTEKFGRSMRYALDKLQDEIGKDSSIRDPQTRAIAILVERLFAQVGQKYHAACEIIIEYLVKRCDLFNADTKQSK